MSRSGTMWHITRKLYSCVMTAHTKRREVKRGNCTRKDRSHAGTGRTKRIDLFTDTAAILNLLDLRSIMGCPGGTRSVFTCASWAKSELHCEKDDYYYIQALYNDLFPITIFFEENVKKNWPEKRA